MEIFEQLLSETPKKFSFFERKVFLPRNKNINLFGPPSSGKTSLALLHALEKKEPFLYMDLCDYRIEKFDKDGLCAFAKEKKLSTIVLDNADGEVIENHTDIQFIVISKTPLEAGGYEQISLGGLDFEEYLSFYERVYHGKRESEFEEERIPHIFASFLKDGSNPRLGVVNELEKRRALSDIIKKIATTKTEEAIAVEFLRKTATKLSLLQVFTLVKSKTKISKDFFYSYTTKLQNSGVLFFVEKLHQKNSSKKIYSYDFALKTAVDFKKDFSAVFENMVFLELNSRGYEIYYTDEAGFFVPELEKAVVAKAFAITDDEKKLTKLSKKAWELGIREVEIVTVNKEDEKIVDGVRIQSLPFWQWALSL